MTATLDAMTLLYRLARDEEWKYRLEALRIANALASEVIDERPLPRDLNGRAPLTKRQREVFEYLRSYDAEHGYMPSFVDIAEHFGFGSLATVHEHLTNIENRGWVRRGYHCARAIVLVADPPPTDAAA